jgi:hypothetical protein
VGRAGEQHWVPAIRVFSARGLHAASGQHESIRARRGQSRLRRDGVQLVGRISRAPSYRGRHMANPETTTAPVGGGAFASVRQQYGMTASCSPIQMDVKPVGADSRYWRSIPIAHHRNAGTYDRLCSPLQSCSSSGSRYHRNLHQDEFGPTRAERMQALAGGGRSHHRSSAFSKFPANSLQFPALC